MGFGLGSSGLLKFAIASLGKLIFVTVIDFNPTGIGARASSGS